MQIDFDDLYSDEFPFSKADYEAVKKIAVANGGYITNDEIFSITCKGYSKLARIKSALEAENILVNNEESE